MKMEGFEMARHVLNDEGAMRVTDEHRGDNMATGYARRQKMSEWTDGRKTDPQSWPKSRNVKQAVESSS